MIYIGIVIYIGNFLLTKENIITWGPGQVPVCPWPGLSRRGGGGLRRTHHRHWQEEAAAEARRHNRRPLLLRLEAAAEEADTRRCPPLPAVEDRQVEHHCLHAQLPPPQCAEQAEA